MRKLRLFHTLPIMFVLLLASCSSNAALSPDNVKQALREQGLEVTSVTLAEAELLASSPLDINGYLPVTYELSLPTADMAHREFVFVYVFETEKERIRNAPSEGSPQLVAMTGLHANTVSKGNLTVIYWSYSESDKSLMRRQFNTAMDKL